jgi:hypothetical protein
MPTGTHIQAAAAVLAAGAEDLGPFFCAGRAVAPAPF